jgi:hypothetical protein
MPGKIKNLRRKEIIREPEAAGTPINRPDPTGKQSDQTPVSNSEDRPIPTEKPGV